MKHYLFVLLLLLSVQAFGQESLKTDTLSFVFNGKRLSGFIDLPDTTTTPSGVILLIPGSGTTNMADNGYYKRLRRFFVKQGLACYVWDKAGCGTSEGVFNEGSEAESAREVIAAIDQLKRRSVPGAKKIGLWSLSRGGLVCPLVIKDFRSIAFWISVSGPDGEETFGYFLEQNFLIEGRSKEQTSVLMKAWHSNLDIARHGGTFEENQKATEPLRNDSFYQFISNGTKPTKEGYLKWQKSLLSGENLPVDEKTGLQIYVPDFDKVLERINCPVLAIFGEKDTQVDWRKTRELYKKHIGKAAGAALTIRTFPDGNHNLFKSKTGGFREQHDKIAFCEDYFETMSAWMRTVAFSN